MQLKTLIQDVNSARIVGKNTENWEGVSVAGLSDDSRFIQKGEVFFCRNGQNYDTHFFAEEAKKRGAVAIVCERELGIALPQILVDDSRRAMAQMAATFYGYPANVLKVIGITGTNGKTTTSYMLRSILQAAGKQVGIIGTLGIYYGRKMIAPELTTPDPIFLQKTLADMVEEGVEYVVMEVSAHALYYQKDASIRYAACIFTNLTQDHLDFFPTMEEYASAKESLFLPKKCPICILNGDEEMGRKIGASRENGVVFYGMETPCDAFAIVEQETLCGSEFVLNVLDDLCSVQMQMTGRHNVYNALAAATCARMLGVAMSQIKKGLTEIKQVKGRLEMIGEYAGARIFVDFAHTPDGLEKSLNALKKHAKGRLLCLFGCGGNRDKSKRPLMGETVAKVADFAVLTSDNPRYEDPMDIICAIEWGYRKYSSRYVIVPDREKAIEYALESLQEGDVLLVAGKGGERYQEIMGIKYLLSDDDIIKTWIGGRKER
ncbi:MAG: UDP-N-acetylmuramoyl-L-alanyl-D-glutamate--2,6-diaminopimelate ligase [Clostridiales bacterium]|nr:UDP-N-acetylmuramoyl-L-alanyl-D-glutamate--2,6-diaminopimelate ligase [Clostridiales bacterium]